MQMQAKFAPMIDKAIESYAGTDEVLWDYGVLPNPQGQPKFTVFISLKGLVLGTAFEGSFNVGDPHGMGQPQIDGIIEQALGALREVRSRDLEDQRPPETAPGLQEVVRGAQRPSGLLIPNR